MDVGSFDFSGNCTEDQSGKGIWYDIQILVLAYCCTFTNGPSSKGEIKED